MDQRALVAVDLGAESCRVSLLRWIGDAPAMMLVHRFANAPVTTGDALHWDINAIEAGVLHGLRLAAELAPEGIRSVAVDGWAVDYVRVNEAGDPLADPFCYRDLRTVAAEQFLHRHISAERLRALTAIQPMRINTLYQLHADRLTNHATGHQWLNLPEYILLRLGGRAVSEATNAGHTQLVDAATGAWSDEVFKAADLDITRAPQLVAAGTVVGSVSGSLCELPAFRNTQLIAPACHDTASAIAGIPAVGDDWAYISSGTWSLVGALVPRAILTPAAAADGFTNLAAAGGATCFHVNVNGMWLIKQCMEEWAANGRVWEIAELVTAAELEPEPPVLLDVDEPELLLPGAMLERINLQLARRGAAVLSTSHVAAPAMARLIFSSLAARYKDVLQKLQQHTGRQFQRVFVVGGGSRNELLNRLLAEETGLQVERGAAESSTVGNFAMQLAVLAGGDNPAAALVGEWARRLSAVEIQ